MFDHYLRPLKDKSLKLITPRLADVDPNHLSIIGLGCGFAAAACIVLNWVWFALIFWGANRFLDGLDGAVARAHGKASDWGGSLELVLDWISYSLIPLAAAAADPPLWPAVGLLLATCYVNLGSVMFLSSLNEKRRATRGQTAIDLPIGYIEGAETAIIYALLILFPGMRMLTTFLFAIAVAATTAQRSFAIYANLQKTDGEQHS